MPTAVGSSGRPSTRRQSAPAKARSRESSSRVTRSPTKPLSGVVAFVDAYLDDGQPLKNALGQTLVRLGAEVRARLPKNLENLTHLVWKDGNEDVAEKAADAGVLIVSDAWVYACDDKDGGNFALETPHEVKLQHLPKLRQECGKKKVKGRRKANSEPVPRQWEQVDDESRCLSSSQRDADFTTTLEELEDDADVRSESTDSCSGKEASRGAGGEATTSTEQQRRQEAKRRAAEEARQMSLMQRQERAAQARNRTEADNSSSSSSGDERFEEDDEDTLLQQEQDSLSALLHQGTNDQKHNSNDPDNEDDDETVADDESERGLLVPAEEIKRRDEQPGREQAEEEQDDEDPEAVTDDETVLVAGGRGLLGRGNLMTSKGYGQSSSTRGSVGRVYASGSVVRANYSSAKKASGLGRTSMESASSSRRDGDEGVFSPASNRSGGRGGGGARGVFDMSPDGGEETENTVLDSTDCDARKTPRAGRRRGVVDSESDQSDQWDSEAEPAKSGGEKNASAAAAATRGGVHRRRSQSTSPRAGTRSGLEKAGGSPAATPAWLVDAARARSSPLSSASGKTCGGYERPKTYAYNKRRYSSPGSAGGGQERERDGRETGQDTATELEEGESYGDSARRGSSGGAKGARSMQSPSARPRRVTVLDTPTSAPSRRPRGREGVTLQDQGTDNITTTTTALQPPPPAVGTMTAPRTSGRVKRTHEATPLSSGYAADFSNGSGSRVSKARARTGTARDTNDAVENGSKENSGDAWICWACTLENKLRHHRCVACKTHRRVEPLAPSSSSSNKITNEGQKLNESVPSGRLTDDASGKRVGEGDRREGGGGSSNNSSPLVQGGGIYSQTSADWEGYDDLPPSSTPSSSRNTNRGSGLRGQLSHLRAERTATTALGGTTVAAVQASPGHRRLRRRATREEDPQSCGGDKEASEAETPVDNDGGVAAEMLGETRRLAAGISPADDTGATWKNAGGAAGARAAAGHPEGEARGRGSGDVGGPGVGDAATAVVRLFAGSSGPSGSSTVGRPEPVGSAAEMTRKVEDGDNANESEAETVTMSPGAAGRDDLDDCPAYSPAVGNGSSERGRRGRSTAVADNLREGEKKSKQALLMEEKERTAEAAAAVDDGKGGEEAGAGPTVANGDGERTLGGGKDEQHNSVSDRGNKKKKRKASGEEVGHVAGNHPFPSTENAEAATMARVPVAPVSRGGRKQSRTHGGRGGGGGKGEGAGEGSTEVTVIARNDGRRRSTRQAGIAGVAVTTTAAAAAVAAPSMVGDLTTMALDGSGGVARGAGDEGCLRKASAAARATTDARRLLSSPPSRRGRGSDPVPVGMATNVAPESASGDGGDDGGGGSDGAHDGHDDDHAVVAEERGFLRCSQAEVIVGAAMLQNLGTSAVSAAVAESVLKDDYITAAGEETGGEGGEEKEEGITASKANKAPKKSARKKPVSKKTASKKPATKKPAPKKSNRRGSMAKRGSTTTASRRGSKTTSGATEVEPSSSTVTGREELEDDDAAALSMGKKSRAKPRARGAKQGTPAAAIAVATAGAGGKGGKCTRPISRNDPKNGSSGVDDGGSVNDIAAASADGDTWGGAGADGGAGGSGAPAAGKRGRPKRGAVTAAAKKRKCSPASTPAAVAATEEETILTTTTAPNRASARRTPALMRNVATTRTSTITETTQTGSENDPNNSLGSSTDNSTATGGGGRRNEPKCSSSSIPSSFSAASPTLLQNDTGDGSGILPGNGPGNDHDENIADGGAGDGINDVVEESNNGQGKKGGKRSAAGPRASKGKAAVKRKSGGTGGKRKSAGGDGGAGGKRRRGEGNGGGRGGGGGGGGGGRKGGTGGKDGDGEGGQEKKKALEGIVRIAFSGLQSGDRQAAASVVRSLSKGHKPSGSGVCTKDDEPLTHLVIPDESRRTLKVLFALCAPPGPNGHAPMVVTVAWLYASLEVGFFVESEPFRPKRYRGPVAEGVGGDVPRTSSSSCSISSQLISGERVMIAGVTDPPTDVLERLLRAAGGEVTRQLTKATLVLVESEEQLDAWVKQRKQESATEKTTNSRSSKSRRGGNSCKNGLADSSSLSRNVSAGGKASESAGSGSIDKRGGVEAWGEDESAELEKLKAASGVVRMAWLFDSVEKGAHVGRAGFAVGLAEGAGEVPAEMQSQDW